MRTNSNIVFKTYNQQQAMLLPPDLDELIDKNHPVRVINTVLDSLDIESITKKYKGGGTSSYHPRMLLKVLVYAYISNEYSSRRIEALLSRDVQFMWLAGMSRPDHNTINRFRSEKLKGVLKNVFTQIVTLLAASGHVGLKDINVDGTKIEANANRYTFVWGNAIKTNKEKMAVQLQQLWDYAEGVAAEELKDKRPTDFAPINPEAVSKTIADINDALKDKEVDKKVKQKLKYAEKNWPGNTAKYNEQEKILDGRNSYSKTDPDSSFMKMKEDHMQNGQLKPGYNVQISTEDQYVLNYTLHPNPTDTLTLPAHVEDFNEQLQTLPQTLTADAGYGSEQNYEVLEQQGIEAYVKYNYFDKEQQGKINEFAGERLHYNAQDDYIVCPMGQHMQNIGTHKRITQSGYQQNITRYQAQNCQGCPMRGICHKSKTNRIVELNHNLIRLKKQAAEKLRSEEGIRKRKKRCADVEPVFANWKQNKSFRRTNLRGKEKVLVEIGLIALAHNLQKFSKPKTTTQNQKVAA
ncbi:MAG TPA: IS1182 family transposase [Ferruginibacter sp.]|nr:IS1182 family transposase [Ferruginibacter sp.]